jgi:hypothetical protein
MRIYKYTLKDRDIQNVQMHPGRILHVGEQGNNICIWALVDTELPLKTRRFAVVLTGASCPCTLDQYLATVKLFDGRVIGHVFEMPMGE